MTSLFDTPHFNAQLFFPRADRSPCPAGAMDHQLAMEAGVTLHARIHRAPDARATILLFHGNGEVVADYDELASSFHDVGADLALVDFRGYGLSTGTPTLRSAIDDAPRALSLLRRELRTPLIVFGRSLGGVCAAELAGRADTGAVGIVLESSGADLGTLLARRGFAPQPLSAEEQRVFAPGPKLARCTVPTLVLHGAEDRLISPDEARMSATALGASLHELVLVPNRGHNDLSLSTVYWDALRRFIDRVTQ